MKQRFGLELYSVRGDLERDFVGTLQAVKDMGYEAVEFFGAYARPAEEVAAALTKTGLVCCGWHTPFDHVQDDRLDAAIAYNKAIGNRNIVIPGLPRENTASPEAWRKTAEFFNGLSRELTLQGMTVGYHNHSSEFVKLDGQTPYDIFFDNTDRAVVMQLDNGNALSGGADVCAYVRKYPGRARTVHLKPYSLRDGFDTMIGRDDIPWTEFMGLCQSVGGTQWYIVEYESEKLYEPLEGVRLCLDALRQMQREGKI
jgi:sugar phosphate isomerase/epimerase